MVKLHTSDGSVLECSVEEFMQIARAAGFEAPSLGENEIEVDGVIYEKVNDSADEGDYIVYDEAPRSYLTSGKPYVVKYVDSCDDPHIVDDEGDDFDTYSEESYTVYRKKAPSTTAEVLSNENVEIGDKFVVVNNDTNNFNVGDIIALIEKYSLQNYHNFKRASDGLNQVLSYDEVRRATQEEIIAGDPDNREQSFLKFGREVDELKEGDIVELIRKPGFNGYDVVGSLHYIDGVSDEDVHLKHVAPLKEGIDTYTAYTDIKLVAPVERLN